MPARNTLVQLLAVYINPKSHNAQRHRQTDRRTDERTDGQQDDANSRSYCVAVRSAKKQLCRGNENIDKKLSCCCDSRSYCQRHNVYSQTIKPVSVTSWRTAATHDTI